MSNMELNYKVTVDEKYKKFVILDQSYKGNIESNGKTDVKTIFSPKDQGVYKFS